MKKHFIRLLAVVVVAFILIAAAPLGELAGFELPVQFDFTASAAETEGYYTYVISANQAIISDCDTSASGDITIPSTLGGYPVAAIRYRAFKECVGITGIVIPDGVTVIDIAAFAKCTNLKHIEIPDSVTSIGGSAFNMCESLEEISISKNVESIGSGAFSKCYSLKKIVVDEENGYYSSDEYGVLFNKDKTELIAYPASAEAEHYVIPESVEVIAKEAFRYSENLVGVTIPDGIERLEIRVFADCSKLKSVTIPDSIKYIATEAFYNCSSLSKVDLGEGVEHIRNCVFLGCPINEIVIPDNVKRIDEYAFSSAPPYTVIVGKGVETLGHRAFSATSKITVDSENKYFSSDENGVLFNKDKTVLIQFPTSIEAYSYDIPYGVETIRKSAFRRAKLATVNIPSSVKTIEEYAFYECFNFTHIIFPEGVTQIGPGALYLCYNIEYIHLPKSLTKIGDHLVDGCGVFKFCTVSDDCYAITHMEEWFGTSASSWYKQCDGHGLVNNDQTDEDHIDDGNANDGNTNDDNENKEPSPEEEVHFIEITKPKVRTINYGDILSIYVEEVELSEGMTIKWFVDGSGVATRMNDDGTECRVTSIANGNVTITAKIVDENGKVVLNAEGEEIADSVNIVSNAGFFQKLISFFKNLFGINRIVY